MSTYLGLSAVSRDLLDGADKPRQVGLIEQLLTVPTVNYPGVRCTSPSLSIIRPIYCPYNQLSVLTLKPIQNVDKQEGLLSDHVGFSLKNLAELSRVLKHLQWCLFPLQLPRLCFQHPLVLLQNVR